MRPLRLPTLITITLLALLLLSGCASKPKPEDVTFQPTENQNVTSEKESEASYLIPVPTAAEGKVNVSYKGIEDARTKQSEAKVPSLHLQLQISSKSEKGLAPWAFDVRNQQLSLRNQESSFTPTWAHSPGQTFPVLQVAPGETKTVDLYYALPEDKRSATEIPGFTLNWQVQTSSRLVAEATSFDQVSKNLRNTAVYPFTARPYDYDPLAAPVSPVPRGPASVPSTSDWWMNPLSDMPYPWSDMYY